MIEPASVVRIQFASYRSDVAVFMRAARSSAYFRAKTPATPDAPDGLFPPWSVRYASSSSAAVPVVAGAAIDVPVAVA